MGDLAKKTRWHYTFASWQKKSRTKPCRSTCNTDYTGVMLNFHALVPDFWKVGLIHCLLNQAKVICSSDGLFRAEVEKLQKLFLSNGYPRSFFR